MEQQPEESLVEMSVSFKKIKKIYKLLLILILIPLINYIINAIIGLGIIVGTYIRLLGTINLFY